MLSPIATPQLCYFNTKVNIDNKKLMGMAVSQNTTLFKRSGKLNLA